MVPKAIKGAGNFCNDRPGCEHVKVVYRRGPDEIPARKIELEGAVEEGIEFIYNTQQVEIIADGDDNLKMRCVQTEAGEPDESNCQ